MIAIGLSGLMGTWPIAKDNEESYTSVTVPIVQLSQMGAQLSKTVREIVASSETMKHNAGSSREANALAASVTSMADAGIQVMQKRGGTIARISERSAKMSDITSARLEPEATYTEFVRMAS